jgi:RNA polymerase sigma-70 factor (ECF subfamily)
MVRVKGGYFAMTMMSSAEVRTDLAEILAAAHRGDQSAWEVLFRECYPKVRRVVRRKLNRQMQNLYDSTDFASDVMKSLVANFGHLAFPSIDLLLAFLAQVAEQKVIDEYRRRNSLKRDMTRERPIFSGGIDAGPVQLPSDEPTASQVAQANEVHERLLSGVDETERTIIELKKERYSNAEIAERTGWNIRRVQRFLKDLQDSMHASGG